ncbi:LysM peptidoglycan-binding domain-containing protein [Actinotalea sp. K2]|uniref:LysM peptidoglycan-binding domain-containing protein n=1 Tax=Actinotalea sp. K2 TaxID=2939438 RepID=UPI00201828C1|nr:LysM peptidoglycan-binding domain-containing protein [Actinotalea sp. K2]MCL3862064.1 LysM peptidoglycan-binding domain-containing protein [Actinotalea sp. K2]
MTTATRHTSERNLATLWRGMGALVTLAVLLVGVPVLLAVLSPVRLPSRGPTWDEVVGAWTRPDDGTVVWGIMTAGAWVCWLVFALQVVASLIATVRATELPAIRGLGWLQQGATTLVTTALLVLTTYGPSLSVGAGESAVAAARLLPAAPPGEGRGLVATPVAADPGDGAGVWRVERPPIVPASDPGPDVVDLHPSVTVRLGDTLWDLAERHLGSGHRYVEIVTLNHGTPQADGLALTDEHWIEAGWILRLPIDATNLPARTPPSAELQPAAVPEHVVVPGNTLWGIAAEHLNDGARFPEVFDLNAGVTQPDGSSLTDPDLIRPGWRLALPAEAAVAPTAAPSEPAVAEEPAPRPSAGVEPRAIAPAPAAEAASAAEPSDGVKDGAAVASNEESVSAGAEPGVVDLDAAPQPSTALVLGVTGFAAALLLAELDRRRRRQRRLRRTGESLPVPAVGSPGSVAEAELRRAVVPLSQQDLDRTFRRLLLNCRTAERSLPRVVAVLLDLEHVDLLLAADEADAVAPFASAGPRRWRASHAEILNAPSHSDEDDVANPYPVLVGLGQRGTASLLANLEAAGTLSIIADTEMASATLRALACELACQPLEGHVPPFVTEELGDLIDTDNPDLVTPLRARPEVYPSILAAYATSFTALGVKDVLAARGLPGQADGWLSTVHLGSPVPPTVALPWSGLVTVAVGEHGGWRLVVDPDGSGRLDPLGLDLAVAHLREDTYRSLLTALRTAREEPVREALVPPGVIEEIATVRDSLTSETADSSDDFDAASIQLLHRDAEPVLGPPAPRILLLGRPLVTGHVGGPGAKRERRLTEIVAYLALHPGASTEAIDEILGRGQRVTASTRNAYISRARAWLGRAPDGTPYLPILTTFHSYRLDPAVRTDWDDFRDLLRAGVQADADGAPALRAALDLVRGRPFADAPVGTYDWAEPLAHQMIDQIVDAAHLYAVLEAGGDYRSVREALAIALSVDPCNELLHRDAIAAAHRAGDVAEVDRLVAVLQHRVFEIDPDDGLEEETVELLVQVRGRRS